MQRLVAVLLILSTGFAVTLDSAIQKVASLSITKPGESLDSKPPIPVTVNEKEYYVVDIMYAGKIVTMVVVGDDILFSDYAKEIMRTHYIAYYFYTDKSVQELLDNLKEKAADWEGQLSKKHSTYMNIIKPQLNYSFSKEFQCLNTMSTMISESENIQNQIISLNFTIKTPNDAERVFTEITNVLNKYLEYLNDMEHLMDDCDAFVGEVISSDMKNENPNLASSIIQTVSINGREYLPDMRNNIRESVMNIQEFYETTQDTVNMFYEEFLSRYNRTSQWKEIEALYSRFKNATNEYYNLSRNYYKIKSKKDFTELENLLLNISETLNSSEYVKARELLNQAEDIIQKLKKEIQHYKPPEPGVRKTQPNLILPLILVFILLILIFLYKRRGSENEETAVIAKYFDYE